MQILMSNSADESLDSIFENLSKLSVEYANKTIDNIYLTINRLGDFPYIGRYIPELQSKHFRECFYKYFRIIYYVSEADNKIYIRYIFSSKQNSNFFFNIHKKQLFEFLSEFFI